MKKRKITIDMLLNVLSSAVPVFMLQIFIYPELANHFTDEKYGLMITLYSVWIMISNTLGNVLFNVRLLRNDQYIEENLAGDFMYIFIRWNIFNLIAILFFTLFYCKGFDAVHIIFGISISFLIILKSYIDVGFRLVINYVYVFVSGLLLGLGYLIGAYLAIKTGIWEMVFLMGYMVSTVYTMKKVDILKESKKKTKFYLNTKRDCNLLLSSTIISKITIYADKLILYPMMGGHVVAIYYNATILAKIASMVTGPISGVVLTYISRWKTDKKNMFMRVILAGLIISLIFYPIILLMSRPILSLMYPKWVDEIMLYIPFTTINVLIQVLISVVQPFFLKFCDLKWQVIVNSLSSVIYFSFSLILLQFYGLYGFCFGTIIGSLLKFFIIIFVYKKRRINYDRLEG